ncbi:MAG TPA: hypothetical protein VMU77_00770, partial [Acidimicrobiales bacterium]|nr:hypothetical protein [Acidimicrobiales bacterium]
MPIKLNPPRHVQSPGFLTFHPFAFHASLHSLALTIVILGLIGVASLSLFIGLGVSLRSVKRRLNDL